MNTPLSEPTGPGGLWAFKNMTFDPSNGKAVRILFNDKASKLHKKQLLDAIHAWMMAQKMIMDNGGRAPTPEQVQASLAAHLQQGGQADAT